MGLGTTFAAIPGLIVRCVPAHETGSALGFYQVVRFTGFSLVSALAATVLAAHGGGNGQPTVGGYTLVLWLSAGICVVAALAWFPSVRSPRREPAGRPPTGESGTGGTSGASDTGGASDTCGMGGTGGAAR